MTEDRFSISVRINYEDTDAGGVVYYANYLAYMERARNACLRDMGFPLSELQYKQKLIFVVAEASLKYIMPARLDDLIQITLAVLDIRGAAVNLSQQVIRSKKVLVDSTIKLVTLNSDTFSPCRIPENLRQSLERHRIEYAGL
ncbi:MAG: YbgC/FadM family acyl-CoA thioesterase [bacterium]